MSPTSRHVTRSLARAMGRMVCSSRARTTTTTRAALVMMIRSSPTTLPSSPLIMQGRCRTCCSNSKPSSHRVLQADSEGANPPAPSTTTESASETTTDEKTKDVGRQEPLDGLFPWRPAPILPQTFFERLVKTFREFIPQSYIRGLFLTAMSNTWERPMEEVPDMLHRTYRFAFIQAVRAIFDGHAKTPPPSWEPGAEHQTSEEETSTVGYPPLSDIMDDKLLGLYEGVFEHFKSNKRVVKMDLEQVRVYRIGTSRLIVGPPRGSPVQPGSKKHSRLGVTVVAKSVPDDMDWGRSLMKQIKPELVQDPHYLFQMEVFFRCKELFAVTDEDTEELLQGQEAYQDILHRVVFEVDFDNRGALSSPWKIVDIDDFLGGNEYLPELVEEDPEKK